MESPAISDLPDWLCRSPRDFRVVFVSGILSSPSSRAPRRSAHPISQGGRETRTRPTSCRTAHAGAEGRVAFVAGKVCTIYQQRRAEEVWARLGGVVEQFAERLLRRLGRTEQPAGAAEERRFGRAHRCQYLPERQGARAPDRYQAPPGNIPGSPVPSRCRSSRRARRPSRSCCRQRACNVDGGSWEYARRAPGRTMLTRVATPQQILPRTRAQHARGVLVMRVPTKPIEARQLATSACRGAGAARRRV